MAGLRALLSRLHALILKRRLDDVLDEELRAHVEMLADDLVRAGMSPAEARRTARLRLGGIEQTKQAVRDARALPIFDALGRDLKLACRSLRRTPRFTGIAVVILALGIGANTAPFAILYSTYWRPLPGLTQVDRLARLRLTCEGCAYQWFDEDQIREVAARKDLFRSASAFQQLQADLAGAVDPVRVSVLAVARDYLQTLRVDLLRGRPFMDDTGHGLEPSAIISENLWRQRFSGSDSIVGTHVAVNGIDFTITGVAPKEFVGVNFVGWSNGIRNPDVWVPASMYGSLVARSDGSGLPRFDAFDMVVRLQPGVTVGRVNRGLAGTASRWAEASRRLQGYRVIATPVRGTSGGAFQARRLAVFAFPAVVFVVACANLGALLLARGVARAHEVAVRRALGAGTWQIVRQHLVEDCVLAIIGGVLGLLASSWIANLIVAASPSAGLDLTPDVWMFAVTLGIAAVAVLAFGLVPALVASRIRLRPGANPVAVGQPRRRARLQRALVVAQVALSLMLLALGGALLQAVRGVEATDPGLDASPAVLTASLDLGPPRYALRERRLFWDALADQLSALQGVEAASLAGRAPFGYGSVYYAAIDHPAVAGRAGTLGLRVSPGYLRTVKLPLLRGRDFTRRDTAGAPPVAIVTAELAGRLWPGRDPIGQSFPMSASGGHSARRIVTVVGVAGDIRRRDPMYGARTLLYLPLSQDDGETYAVQRVSLLVRVNGDGMGWLPAVREALRRVDPSVSLFDVATLRGLAEQATVRERVTSMAITGLGLAALFLACIGTFGVMAHTAAQRTREVGIRLALGARPADVVRMGLREGGRLALIGIAAGLLLGIGASRVLVSVIVPGQPVGIAAIVATLALVAAALLLACYLPARRASRLDPVAVLRAE